MDNRQTFNMVKAKHFKTLKQYVPIVARVHGKSHPEFYEVEKIFDVMAEKIMESRSQTLKLDEEFERLREVTKGYTVPVDVCESYEAVYNMLAELDEAYHS